MIPLTVGSNKPGVCIFRTSDRCVYDSRLTRECKTLERAGYSVTVVAIRPRGGGSSNAIPGVNVVEIDVTLREVFPSRVLAGAKYVQFVSKGIRHGLTSGASVFHCHDLPTLPIGYYLSRKLGAHLVYDSAELWLGLRMGSVQRALWSLIERKMIRSADIVISTDEYREKWLKDRYDIDNTIVIRNIPDFEEMRIEECACSERDLRRSLCLPEDIIIGVYFGGIYAGRHIHDIVESAALLPDHIHVALMGSGDPEYLKKIGNTLDELHLHNRIHLLSPVPANILVNFVSTADFAFVLYDDRSLNNRLCSPNKLFESIAAGLPMVATSNPLLRDTVEKHGIGVCVESPVTPENLAIGVMDLISRNRIAMRNTIHRIAGLYVWENEATKLVDAYDSLRLG